MSGTIDALCSQMLPDVWTIVSPPKTDSGYGACLQLNTAMYGNGIYVIAGEYCRPLKSNDGIHWEEVPIPSSRMFTYTCSLYANDLYILSTQGSGLYYSTDCISWRSSVVMDEPDGFTSLVYGNGVYVGVGNSNPDLAFYSTDLKNWNYSVLSGALGITKVVFGGEEYGEGEFCAVTNNRKIFFSSDGINWTEGENGAFPSGGSITSLAYCPGNNLDSRGSRTKFWASDGTLLACTSQPDGRLLDPIADCDISADGTVGGITNIPLGDIKDIAYGNGKLVVMGTASVDFRTAGIVYYPIDIQSVHLSIFPWSKAKLITAHPSKIANTRCEFIPNHLFYVGNRFMMTGKIFDSSSSVGAGWALAYSFG